jgi:hypothetical protein
MTTRVYWAIAVLVVVDLLLLCFSEVILNALGRVDQRGWLPVVTRVIPDLVLLAFYAQFLLIERHGSRRAALFAVLHFVVMVPLGHVVAVLMIGLFAVVFTPVSITLL